MSEKLTRCELTRRAEALDRAGNPAAAKALRDMIPSSGSGSRLFDLGLRHTEPEIVRKRRKTLSIRKADHHG